MFEMEEKHTFPLLSQENPSFRSIDEARNVMKISFSCKTIFDQVTHTVLMLHQELPNQHLTTC